MKKADITIGSIYTAKVTNKVVPVRIEREHPSGGWEATNNVTGKTIHIKSAQRLRAACNDEPKDDNKEATRRGTTRRGATTKKSQARAPRNSKGATRATQGGHGDVPSKDEAEPKKPKRLSLLDAAASVLAKAKEPMGCKEIVEGAMGLGWTTCGKTPHATLYAAMSREIAKKGKAARFVKVDRGRFVAAV